MSLSSLGKGRGGRPAGSQSLAPTGGPRFCPRALVYLLHGSLFVIYPRLGDLPRHHLNSLLRRLRNVAAHVLAPIVVALELGPSLSVGVSLELVRQLVPGVLDVDHGRSSKHVSASFVTRRTPLPPRHVLGERQVNVERTVERAVILLGWHPIRPSWTGCQPRVPVILCGSGPSSRYCQRRASCHTGHR